MAKEVIFVADDFGMTREINDAILPCHLPGHLTGAALMMAQPGTDDAVARARAQPGLQIGWHLHLNDSVPGHDRTLAVGRFPARAGFSIGLFPSARELDAPRSRAAVGAFSGDGPRMPFYQFPPSSSRASRLSIAPAGSGRLQISGLDSPGRPRVFRPSLSRETVYGLGWNFPGPASKIVTLARDRYPLGPRPHFPYDCRGSAAARRHAARRLSRISFPSPHPLLSRHAMPARIKIAAFGLTPFAASSRAVRPAEPPPPAPRPFRYATDTFSFANETVWNYVNGTVQSEASRERQKARLHPPLLRRHPRRRAILEIRPLRSQSAPLRTIKRLAARIREVTERSVWLPALPPKERIVFPGYANLRDDQRRRSGRFPGQHRPRLAGLFSRRQHADRRSGLSARPKRV